MPGCAGPASSLGASRQGRGARARRRRPEERLRPGSTAGLPGASVGGPPSRGGAVRRSRSFLHAAAPRRPPLHTRNSAHPGKRRGTRCSRRGAGSALRAPSPGSLAGRPASRHFLSKKWCAAPGEAEAALGAGAGPAALRSCRLGSCCLPARWGECRRSPRRRGERRARASGHVWAATGCRTPARRGEARGRRALAQVPRPGLWGYGSHFWVPSVWYRDLVAADPSPSRPHP